MKWNKLFVNALTFTLLATPAMTWAHTENDSKREIIPIKDDVEEIYAIGSFTGKVKDISDTHGANGSIYFLIENENNQEAHFIVSNNTYVANKNKIELGDVITGYYNALAPMITIYPPQYPTELIVVQNEKSAPKIDMFDGNLLSSDEQLKLNIAETTKILLPNGKPYNGSLTNKSLAVFYSFSTKSIPAQTTPEKVIVLFEKENILNEYSTTLDLSLIEYVINNRKTSPASPYLSDNGTIMVPLRSITETLGFQVEWDEKNRSIQIGNDILLQLEQDQYTTKDKTITLGTAPTLINGLTYVPLQFFRDIVNMNNAYLFEGQIVINNDEKME